MSTALAESAMTTLSLELRVVLTANATPNCSTRANPSDPSKAIPRSLLTLSSGIDIAYEGVKVIVTTRVSPAVVVIGLVSDT